MDCVFSYLVLNENYDDVGNDEKGQDGEPLIESPAEAGYGIDFHWIRRWQLRLPFCGLCHVDGSQ